MSDILEVGPQPGPQMEALASNAEICIIGGSAGGGKSYALLMDPLRYLFDVPGFHGVLFRRTFPEINLPGGLWDTSVELYKPLGAIPKKSDNRWLFPYDNTISFHHLQHDVTMYDWQGSQITYMGWDELTHFKQSVFNYIVFSRGRSSCEVPSYTRGSCNPDPGWVKTFLAPWVDKCFQEPARSGELRYFIRNDKGAIEWVHRDTPSAISLTFVRARVEDNVRMLERNPRYISMLRALPPVERARLLYGDWDVRREGLVYPDFESCLVSECDEILPTCGGIDYGFNNPFAAVWGHLDSDDILWIIGCRYKRQTTLPVHSEALPRGVRWWCDPARPDETAELRISGHDTTPCAHRPARMAGGEKRTPKMAGIDMVSERMRTGRLRIHRNEQTLSLIRELGMYHYDDTKFTEEPVDEDNHACDALRYLIVGLDRSRYISTVPGSDMDVEIVSREAAERAEEIAKKRAEDLAAQSNIDDERWWSNG